MIQFLIDADLPRSACTALRQRKARLEQQVLAVEREKRRFQALEARISELERRIQVKTEQHESEVGRRQREARILAPFHRQDPAHRSRTRRPIPFVT